MKGIPMYREINQIHAATRSGLWAEDSMFHCFEMKELGSSMRSLPTYRSDFFSLALSLGSNSFNISINGTRFDNLQHSMICVAPGQVTSFEKEGDWEGYCTFFKSEFVYYKSAVNFLEEYPFFNIRQTNIFPLTDEQLKNFAFNYQQIIFEQANPLPYRTEIVRSSFQAILWQVRRIYECGYETKISDKASDIIASKFQYLVSQQYASKIRAEQYAQMLNVTPNHLMQSVKRATGKTAKGIISERRFEEAKFLLKHTQEDIASISDHLNFSEPTHFNKFFKKWSGKTPLTFRRLHLAAAGVHQQGTGQMLRGKAD